MYDVPVDTGIPLSIKCHTPRTTTTAMAMTFMEERPVSIRAAHFTLYAFTKVNKAARETVIQ